MHLSYSPTVASSGLEIDARGNADAARSLRIARRVEVLRHPNIAPAPSVERGPDEVLVASGLLDAERYDALVDASIAAKCAMPLALHLRVLLDVLRGLDVLHALRDASGDLRFVHGHVSPAHVLIGTDGNAKIARAVLAPRPNAYMAPEVRVECPDIDHRADVYSCGVMLWEALASASFGDARRGILARPTPPVSWKDRWAAPLAEVAARAVAAAPEARHASAFELTEEVRRVANGRVATRPALAAFVAKLCRARITARRRELVAKLAAKLDESIPIIDASLDDEPTLVLPLPRSAGPRATEPARRGHLFPLVVSFLGTSALLAGAAYACGFLP